MKIKLQVAVCLNLDKIVIDRDLMILDKMVKWDRGPMNLDKMVIWDRDPCGFRGQKISINDSPEEFNSNAGQSPIISTYEAELSQLK